MIPEQILMGFRFQLSQVFCGNEDLDSSSQHRWNTSAESDEESFSKNFQILPGSTMSEDLRKVSREEVLSSASIAKKLAVQ